MAASITTEKKNSLGVTGFDHTRICVSDLERSKEFYEEFLDMKIDRIPERQVSDELDLILGGTGVGVSLLFGRIAGHIVELIHLDHVHVEVAPTHPHIGNGGFTLTVRDIDAAFKAAQLAGILATPAIVEVHGTKIFFVNDPDGNRIECIQYVDGHAVSWPE